MMLMSGPSLSVLTMAAKRHGMSEAILSGVSRRGANDPQYPDCGDDISELPQ